MQAMIVEFFVPLDGVVVCTDVVEVGKVFPRPWQGHVDYECFLVNAREYGHEESRIALMIGFLGASGSMRRLYVS